MISRKILTGLISFAFLTYIFQTINYAESVNNDDFITLVFPIRSRKVWVTNTVDNFKDVDKAISNRGLNATWLLGYDVLQDQELINAIKATSKKNEIGAFFEISEKLATDAQVAYKLGDGDYYRPDKVFLSGYSRDDREKLIKAYLKKFKSIFGYTPQTVGAWYIDSYSQIYLSKKGIISAVTLSDQFDTDAASIWGKYYSMPFYPSKFNTLEPAGNEKDKIPIVNIQWAQRELTAGYGSGVFDSRQSFQANDYISNGFDFKYFENLLDLYLKQKTRPIQITIGLEVGQESTRFFNELLKQFDQISQLKNNNTLYVITVSEFAKIYMKRFPQISPSHVLVKGQNVWYMSPAFRAAIFKDDGVFKIKDLRFYNGKPFRDYLYPDNNNYLAKRVEPLIDDIKLKNALILDKGPLLNLTYDEKSLRFQTTLYKINITNSGLEINDLLVYKNNSREIDTQRGKLTLIANFVNLKNIVTKPLKLIRYSKINDRKIIGIKIDNTLIGLKGLTPGIYNFPFQIIIRFKSPADFFSWEPWPYKN